MLGGLGYSLPISAEVIDFNLQCQKSNSNESVFHYYDLFPQTEKYYLVFEHNSTTEKNGTCSKNGFDSLTKNNSPRQYIHKLGLPSCI